MGDRNIEEFLQTGSWTTSRAKSPARPTSDNLPTRRTSTRSSGPPRANQSSKLDPHVPRSFNLALHRSRFPPPPSVEDEVESLAREHGSTVVSGTDEEAKFPGDVEQFPIIQEVHEFNPERRFVLVPNSAPSSETGLNDDDLRKNSRQGKGDYEANTCRKFVIQQSDDDSTKEPGRRRGLEKRKSRQDLPRIDTGLQDGQRPAPTGRNRSRSATYYDDPANGYFDRQQQSQPSGDGLLSPVIVNKFSTKGGRDREYLDNGRRNRAASRNRGPSADHRGGPPPDEKRRGDGYRTTHSLDPPPHKRTNSTMDSPRNDRRSTANNGRYREEISSSRNPRNGSPPRTKRRDSSTAARVNRKSNSPPYPPSARDNPRMPGRSPSFKGRRVSPEDDEDSDVDYPRVQRSNRARRASVNQDNAGYLLSPDQANPSARKPSKSRGSTPLASPRVVQNQFPEPEFGASPRSATFPYSKDAKSVDQQPAPPVESKESSPPRLSTRVDDGATTQRSGGRSRASTLLQGAAAAAAIPLIASLPISIPGGTSSPVERRKSPMPPPHGRQNSLEASPPKPYWQPPPFNPTENRVNLDRPIQSYRRYSEDVQQGVIAPLAECPRTVPTAGYFDWLSLPQTRNFDICPACYDATFAKTQFRHSFVAGPMRPSDALISCDFGSSHWYRVAWLMTLKHHIPDLRLLKSIAAVGSKHQECAGGRESSRIWYSILDPYARRPIPTLTVCSHCAKTVEVILPNLYGIFVPLDAPSVPTRGVCDLHFAPGRKRFVKIFDLLEVTSDTALARKTPPDIQALADKIRDVTITQECTRDEPIPGRKWHVMESIPDFTVCEECFEDVVLPIVEGEQSSSVARSFFKRRQERPFAECQLYSDRMRDIFRKACRRDDVEYLEDRVKERLDIEASIKSKLAEHPDEEETRELLKEWQKWE